MQDDQIDEFVEVLKGESRFWIDSLIGPEMRKSASAERMVHLEQTMGADPVLTRLSAEKRQEMTEPSRG